MSGLLLLRLHFRKHAPAFSRSLFVEPERRIRNKRMLVYFSSLVVGIVGLSYASVPLYKLFCQTSGFGGTAQRKGSEALENTKPLINPRLLRVSFFSRTHPSIPWSFSPQQQEIKVIPGETALAFYTAKNSSSDAITGVATYNISPGKAGIYFNKIQCFCFEEQRLKPGEEIDMPVFFYLDPELLDDPHMDEVYDIALSYTFFKSRYSAEDAKLESV